MKRIRVVAGRTMLVSAAVAVGLAGCSALSPATIVTPYPAADGVGLDLPGTGVVLRNFLVIGTAKDKPAAVLGTVVNDSANAVQVSLQTDLGATAQPTQTLVKVGAHDSVQVGPDQKVTMVISDLAVDPGSTLTISAATQAGGRADVSVPVLLPQGQYSSLTPAAPTPTATETPLSPDSADATASADASGTPTPSSTATSSKKKKKKTSKSTPTGSPSASSTAG